MLFEIVFGLVTLVAIVLTSAITGLISTTFNVNLTSILDAFF
jgi:hypothetical protein